MRARLTFPTAEKGAVVLTVLCLVAAPTVVRAAPSGVTFGQSAEAVDIYDFVEITVTVEKPDARNPFTDVVVEGEFVRDGSQAVGCDGYCDSADGSVFRVRFMPTEAGNHAYSVRYKQGEYERKHRGNFTAKDANRRGIVRVDKEHPWHFVWEGTGEHYFYNGTTTYWLMGWDDEQIRKNIDRLHRLKVNRLRVAICGRVKDGRAWYENVFPTDRFKFVMNPWVAERPESVENPGFDVTRFNVPHWQKIERMLRHAREKDMVISIIFYVDGRRPGVDPFGQKGMGGPDEQRYYRYAVARLAAFSNVMWDVANEYRLFRDDAWAEKMGTFIKEWDPYDHLTSTHGHGDFRFRTSPWADFAMYQSWDEHGGYAYMLKNREEQAKTGRPIPQVNEEYGYEDHYPTWGGNRKAPARSADNRRRLAWGMYMAGCYQTTGERADTGTGWGPDSGGGWLNGRGDDTMVMLNGYGHIVDFFSSIPYWKLEPNNDFFQTPSAGSVKAELTHIVYTRQKSGGATVYLDGENASSFEVSGDFSNWDASFRLALANELTKDRPWLGELHQIAVYDRVLNREEVTQRFQAGFGKTADKGALVVYTFREGSGDTIKDVSGRGQPLNMKIENAGAVKWIPRGGLAVQRPVLIASSTPGEKIIAAVKKSNAITIEAWIKPANTIQAGPARIVTLSRDTGERNFTLGQKGDAYEVRLRTTSTSPNGEPALSSPGSDDALRKVCGLRSKEGDLAVLYFPAGGEVQLKDGATMNQLHAQWFNPREGKLWAARQTKSQTFVTPDEQDWVLLFRGK